MHTPNSAELEALQAAAMTTTSPFSSIDSFNKHLPMAEFLARSTIINEVLQNNPANCMLVIEVANRSNISVMSVAQKLQVIDGKLVWPPDIDDAMEMRHGAGNALMGSAVGLAAHVTEAPSQSEPDMLGALTASVSLVGMQTPTQAVRTATASSVKDVAYAHEQADCANAVAVPSGAASHVVRPVSNPVIRIASSSAPARNAASGKAAPGATLNRAGDASADPVIRNIDLGTYKEICLRADSSAGVAAAAKQLPQVLERDRRNAEKEVLEQALICLSEETTVDGMAALASARIFFSDANLNIFKGAYNARAEALNKAKAS